MSTENNKTEAAVRTNRLSCAQCEGMAQDAADGALMVEEQLQFDLHIAGCAQCQRHYADAQRGAAWMEMLREVPPVPPANLVDQILAKTSGNPDARTLAISHLVQTGSLLAAGPARVLPFRAPASPVARMMATVMQPRFAMTAAMAFFSIALTLNLAGVRLNQLHAIDLSPTSVKRSFWSVNNRAVRYYDNLRVVYEMESRVRELQRDTDSDSGATTQRGIVNEKPAQKSAPAGQPRSAYPAPKDAPEKSERNRMTPKTEQIWKAQLAVRVKGARA